MSNRLKAELDQDKQSMKELEHIISKVDALSEELKTKRKQIAELENNRAQLVAIKSQFVNTNRDKENLIKENERLKNEIDEIKKELYEIKAKRQNEIEKYKRSFDDMDKLVEKERETHKHEEDNLKNNIKKLNEEIERLKDIIKNLQQEKINTEHYQLELNEIRNKARLQVAEALDKVRQKEIKQENDSKEMKAEISVIQNKAKELEITNEKLNAEVLKLAQYQSLFGIEKDKVILYLY